MRDFFLLFEGMSSVREELASLRENVSKIPNTELIARHPSLVQIKLRSVVML